MKNYDLDRFVKAQERDYSIALDEFVRGKKEAIGFGTYFRSLQI